MRWAIAGRWSTAWLILPITFAVGGAHAATGLATRDGYTVSDLASSGYIVYLLAPIYAGTTAFALRGWWRLQSQWRGTRAGSTRLLNALGPLWIGSVLVTLLVVSAGALSLPNNLDSLLVVAVAAGATATAVLCGAVASWALPTVAAVPVAAVGSFMWIAFLPSTSSPILHYLTPTITGCCAPPVQPSRIYIQTMFIVFVSLTLAVLLLTSWRGFLGARRLIAAPLAVGVVLVPFALGALRAQAAPGNLTLTPVTARTGAQSCREADSIRVCTWPELEPRQNEIAAFTGRLNILLTTLQLPPIGRIQEGTSADDAVAIAVFPRETPTGLQRAIVDGYVKSTAPCAAENRDEGDARVIYLAVKAGLVGIDELRGSFAPSAISLARTQLAQGNTPRPDEWFRAQEPATNSPKCSG